MGQSFQKFWNIKPSNQGSDAAEVWIYDVIGEGWWFEGVAAKDFCKEVAALNVKQLDVRINSPGGSIPDGVAIANALRRHPANVTTYIDAEASSIATHIAMAGNKWLAMAIGDLRKILKLARLQQLNAPGRLAQSLKEHLAIFAAIQARDPQAAADAMHEHLSRQRIALRSLRQTQHARLPLGPVPVLHPTLTSKTLAL